MFTFEKRYILNTHYYSMNQRNYQFQGGGNPLGSITSVLILVLFFVGLFFIARGIFYILSWLAPIFIIATLFIDYKVITGYLKWIGQMFKRNPFFGIGLVLLTVFGFPIVSGFLFGKAMFKRKISKVQQEVEMRQKGEFVDFEEMDTEIHEPLELPDLKKEQPKQKPSNDYDTFFE